MELVLLFRRLTYVDSVTVNFPLTLPLTLLPQRGFFCLVDYSPSCGETIELPDCLRVQLKTESNSGPM
jgi:hypothetical protein